MDFFNELYLSALISILLAFLLGKFASSASDHHHPMDGPTRATSPSQPVDQVNTTEQHQQSKIEEQKEKEKETEMEIERIEGFGEWEGIERSGAEGLFREAVNFAGGERGKAQIGKLGKEEQLRLYGLGKVATEGPCYHGSWIKISVSSRAKWNAWQKLGDMNPEIAMERYVTLLSELIPDWNEPNIKEDSSPKPESSSDFSQNANINQVAVDQIQSKQGLTPTVLLNLLGPTRMTFLTSLYL